MKQRTITPVEIAMVVVLVVLVVGTIAWRQFRGRTPEESAHVLDLTVSHGEFVLRITNNEGVPLGKCLITVDRRYTFQADNLVGWTSDPSHRNTTRIHLGDFTRGADRYDWQRRSPSLVEVACEEIWDVNARAYVPMKSHWAGAPSK